MFYKKNTEKTLSKELFKNPTSEYRGTPFWAWNDDLDKDELLWQIEQLKSMGFGGFHMHTRSGMATKYLSSEFMDLIKACTSKAKEEEMLAYLYDEDRWPSGAAGGIVTKEKRFRQKALLLICDGNSSDVPISVTYNSYKKNSKEIIKRARKDTIYLPGEDEKVMWERRYDCEKNGQEYVLAVYDMIIDSDGYLVSAKNISYDDVAVGKKWYAIVVCGGEMGWFNGQAYLDTLKKEAVDEFIKVTYEAYKEAVGEEFGKVVPSMFTDEPQFERGEPLENAKSEKPVKMAWTTDIPHTFKAKYGVEILEHIPEIFWDERGKSAIIRYQMRDHICQRFTEAYSDNCGEWCEKNGILFTGHLMEEYSLYAQTKAVGETMRSYRKFGIPGMDLLCNNVELCTAKQVQSAVHQFKREGMLSELYGVTGWDFDFRGHKWQGDWQAALGVTVRVPHLSWYSMKGSAKRDYPASISYQSAWYKDYKYIEDHFARLNTALTRGKPSVKVGVIHPIESYWLAFGPNDIVGDRRKQLHDNFENVMNWLLRGFIDFDFISESLLPEQLNEVGKTLGVGAMQYDVVVVPELDTIRQSTIDILTSFIAKGGRVVYMGSKPRYVNAYESNNVDELYALCEKIEFTEYSLLTALENEREISIRLANGESCKDYIYNKRIDNDCEWVFITRLSKPKVKGYREDEVFKPDNLVITFKGKVKPTIYNTLTGEVEEISYKVENGNTLVECSLYNYDSRLFKLEKTEQKKKTVKKKERKVVKEIDFKEKVKYSLSEDNVLLLDMCKWSEDGKVYQDKEEILRIDSSLRAKYGYPNADGHDVQPWVIGETKPEKQVYLKFEFDSKINVPCSFAFEEADKIWFNGKEVEIKKDGYFVDKRIYKTAMPDIKKGKNELIVLAPLGKRISLENYFILGQFAVKVEGTQSTVYPLDKKIAFGSVIDKGLPFYGAGISYELDLSISKKSDIKVKVQKYAGALIKVKVDGEYCGNIVFIPNELVVQGLKRGKHKIEIIVELTRINCFGALHASSDLGWKGPISWYTKDSAWAYEYQLTNNGVLKSPTIQILD